MLPEVYVIEIQKSNQGDYSDLVHCISKSNRTATLKWCMEQLTALDMSFNKSEPKRGCGANANRSTNVSTRKIDLQHGGITCTAGMAKEYSLTCYNCGQAGDISCNRLNCNLMIQQLEPAVVGKDAPKVKSGCQCKDKKQGGSPTGQEHSTQLTNANEDMYETVSEV